MRMDLKIAALCCAALSGPAFAANPYAAAYTVNDRVITRYDIEQRMALLVGLGAAGDLRGLAVEQLTEDRLKFEAADMLGIELDDEDVEIGIEEFAANRGLEIDDVLDALAGRNIDRQTMDDFVLSGLLWREVVIARFRAKATPSEEDVDLALEMQRTTPVEMVQIAEIALPFAERGEAETRELADRLSRSLSQGGSFTAAVREYSRSASAAQGGVLPPAPATSMPPAIRSQILVLRPGQVTRPVQISGGLAILKLVSLSQKAPEVSSDVPEEAIREEARQKLFSERINNFGQGYLQELRSDALIIEK